MLIGYNFEIDNVDVAKPLVSVSPLPKSKLQETAGGGIALTIISSKPQLSYPLPWFCGWNHLNLVEDVWAEIGISMSWLYHEYQGAFLFGSVSQLS